MARNREEPSLIAVALPLAELGVALPVAAAGIAAISKPATSVDENSAAMPGDRPGASRGYSFDHDFLLDVEST